MGGKTPTRETLGTVMMAVLHADKFTPELEARMCRALAITDSLSPQDGRTLREVLAKLDRAQSE